MKFDSQPLRKSPLISGSIILHFIALFCSQQNTTLQFSNWVLDERLFTDKCRRLPDAIE
jgi:hypothetical protein